METCPECEYDEVDVDDMEEGDRLSCPECGKNLVVTGTDEVDCADEDEDDLDDDDEDEEDADDEDDDLDDDDEDTEEEDFDE
jgi:hypothetical protein